MLDDANHSPNTAKSVAKKQGSSIPTSSQKLTNKQVKSKADTGGLKETEHMKCEREAIERLEDPETRAKAFPRHTFRRFRPWAGCKVSEEFIKQEDLARLPRFSTGRAFNPQVNVVASAAARASRSNTSKTSKTAKTAEDANTARTATKSGGPRRNPQRGCRKPQQPVD